MALSTCPKCENSIFELKENSPRHSNFKYNFVQCSECGAVVGVLDFFNISALLHDQNIAINKIAQHLNIQIDLGE
jgi:excinuclease UvrABC ATPase subunit